MLNRVRNNNNSCSWLLFVVRHYSRIQPPRPVSVEPVIRVSNNVARLDAPKEGPKPRQLLSLPPFPGHPLPAKSSTSDPGQRDYVTAVNWIKYYFKGAWGSVIESHFREGLVSIYYLLYLQFILAAAVLLYRRYSAITVTFLDSTIATLIAFTIIVMVALQHASCILLACLISLQPIELLS